MKRFITLLTGIILLSFPYLGKGQVDPLIPPLSEASALAKYGEYLVSLYTGVPNITESIWQIKGHDLTHNVYHSGGIKVSEIASWVGLGWSLKAGGIIIRNLRRLPDDNHDGRGYLTSGFDFDLIELELNNSNYPDNSDLCWKIAKEGYDSEPDIFFFSIGSLSGTFVINCKNGVDITEENIHLTPWQNIVIKPVMEDVEGLKQISGFEIIDQDGIKYTFGNTEESREKTTYSSITDETSSQSETYYSSRHLNIIESRKTGAAISFSYKPVSVEYDDSWSLTEYNRLNVKEGAIDNLDKQIENNYKNTL